ncbi:protein kinase [Diplodia corticola]|uniref:non-specific serine/threonine protein kinase n=1 Tax=Diplodia corticola TaxID=236234 RepID=A0A1J9R7P4_9PEZI|nr:protein kinase [Diplodia corticola]OJD36608.1 protein kinase [Diplodia corticola]
MSLVPRLNRGEIVLRHGSAVVVYDERSRQLSLRARSQGPSDVELANPNCPYCHRPLRDEARSPGDDVPDDNDHGFVNPEYFRMLHHSRPSSETSSRQPSPQRRPPRRALRQTSGGSDIGTPPPGAEFVGSTPATPAAPHGISSTAFSQGYFKTFFVEEGELGRGGKGVVLLVKHMLDGVSLGHFACKRVPVGDDHEWLEKVLVEVQLLQNLSHQNLVSYRHVWLEDYQISAFGPSVPCAFILQQYCNAGDLHNYILNQTQASVTTQQLKERMRRRSKGQAEPPSGLAQPRRMPFEEIFSFFKDITAGLHHLHSHGYIHRDVKPHNCLLHTTGTKTRVLVSDFGEVQMVNVARKSTGATGTISYCAPEVLRRDARGEFGNFTTKSDIFSLGMIVYFMCFGRLPYQNADDLHEENEDLEQLRAEIASWQGFDDVRKARSDLPDKLYSFLKRLLSLDPAERPTTEQILLGIGAGSGLEDLNGFGPPFDDIGPRISSADSPSPSPSKLQRRHSTQTGLMRAPSKLRQQANAEDHRPPSPPTSRKPPPPPSSPSAATGSRTPTPPDSAGLILRKRQLDNYSPPPPHHHHHHRRHSSASPTSPPPTTPRLMLPPPSSPFSSLLLAPRLHALLASPAAASSIKLALFLAKTLSLFRPCSPFAANPFVAFPLLCLAALDFAGPSFFFAVASWNHHHHYYPFAAAAATRGGSGGSRGWWGDGGGLGGFC